MSHSCNILKDQYKFRKNIIEKGHLFVDLLNKDFMFVLCGFRIQHFYFTDSTEIYLTSYSEPTMGKIC